MAIELFCDNCENADDFEKVRVIEVYNPKNRSFEPTTDDIIYIRCRRCGNVNPIEIEEDEDLNE